MATETTGLTGLAERYAVHLGTFVGAAAYFWRDIVKYLGAWGRSILAGPLRQVTAVPRAGRTRAGRYRHVADPLRVKEVDVGEGERRRRDVVCHNPDAAACALRAARRVGRDRPLEARGRRRVNATPGAAAGPGLQSLRQRSVPVRTSRQERMPLKPRV